jgi:hypothetical protein
MSFKKINRVSNLFVFLVQAVKYQE